MADQERVALGHVGRAANLAGDKRRRLPGGGDHRHVQAQPRDPQGGHGTRSRTGGHGARVGFADKCARVLEEHFDGRRIDAFAGGDNVDEQRARAVGQAREEYAANPRLGRAVDGGYGQRTGQAVAVKPIQRHRQRERLAGLRIANRQAEREAGAGTGLGRVEKDKTGIEELHVGRDAADHHQRG